MGGHFLIPKLAFFSKKQIKNSKLMIKQLLFFLISFLLMASSYAQADNEPSGEISIDFELINPSSTINDGIAEVEVKGGIPPFEYKWTNQETSLKSNRSEDLIEGMEYSVTITDSKGKTATETFTIPAESITEVVNSKVQPAVDYLSAVLFWDPFAALGIHDPVIYVSEEKITPPQSEDAEVPYLLKKWLVLEGEQIERKQEVAILERDGEEIIVKADFKGILHHHVPEGDFISPTTDGVSIFEPVIGNVEFDELPVLYPNGDVMSSKIPFIVIWLMLGSLFFTFRLKFINIRGFKHSIDLARGKYDNPNAPGLITHFQAMATAVSATVGLGNIAGVAIAISVGGAGASFWMFVAGFFGMSLKFAECAMGVKYRIIDEDGRIFGGPMNYLRYGLEKKNLKTLGKFLAIFFAVLGVGASFGGGNMLQSNQAFKIVSEQIPFLQGQGFLFGVGFAILIGAVIIGGIKSIARFTERVVPMMAILYVIGCFVVIGFNINNLGAAFSAIFDGAFSADALKGGFIGVLIVGLQRAAFSNEAGIGSAAIAHSASKTNTPIADGFTSLMEPLIDTMVVCTMTALVLIFTGIHEQDTGMGGVELTSQAFGSVVSWFPIVLAVAVFLFAFSTMVSWSYYGMRSWTYIFGRSKKGELVYKLMYLVFVVIGASVSLGAVLTFADMMILAMSFPNIFGLYLLAPEIYADMNDYLDKLKKGKLYINEKFLKT